MMMTEPQSGSDFSGMRTTARKDGDSYVLNGVKIFPTSYSWANFIVVWAILVDENGTPLVDEKAKHMITTFIVDIDNPGLKVLKWIDVLGIDREPIVEIKDCVIPLENMLGEPGKGMNVGMGQMNRARLGWGAASYGSSERCLELAINYAQERMAFDRKLGEFQAIQWMLADSHAELEAMRQLLYYTAWECDKHGDLQLAGAQMRCATIKMFCLERALNIVDQSMQVHGGIGMTDEFPFEYLHRQLKAARAAEGTPQMMRYIIASGLLGRDITRFRK
jgi:alkylation response protein AidB-like acyl-CoA dehydrogenase